MYLSENKQTKKDDWVCVQSNFILTHYNTKKTKNEYWGLKKGGFVHIREKVIKINTKAVNNLGCSL